MKAMQGSQFQQIKWSSVASLCRFMDTKTVNTAPLLRRMTERKEDNGEHPPAKGQTVRKVRLLLQTDLSMSEASGKSQGKGVVGNLFG